MSAKRIYISMMKRVPYPTKVGYGDNGRVICFDWNSKSVVWETDIEDVRDPNSTLSRSHGCRGITIYNDELVVGGGDTRISFLNIDTGDILRTTDTLARRIHQIKVHNGLLYVVSTGSDSYLIFDGSEHIGTEDIDIDFLRKAGYEFLKTEGDNLHFNSICWHPETGDEFHTYYTQGVIVNYTKREIVASGMVGIHDVYFIDGERFVVNDSMNRTSILFDKDGSRVVYKASEAPDDITFVGEKASDNHALWGFTRVVCPLRDSFLVTSAPGYIVEISSEHASIIDTCSTTSDPGDSIYDIVADPRDW